MLRRLLGLAQSAVQIYYLLGNHDKALESLVGADLGNIHIRKHCVHETADRRRVFVLHRDAYDRFVMRYEWVSRLATRAYHLVNVLNHLVSRCGRGQGRAGNFDICRFVRVRAKQFADYLGRFGEGVTQETLRRECEAVVCGHMHKPRVSQYDGVEYYNAGDRVEHCTAMVEDFTGRVELIHYPAHAGPEAAEAPTVRFEAPGQPS